MIDNTEPEGYGLEAKCWDELAKGSSTPQLLYFQPKNSDFFLKHEDIQEEDNFALESIVIENHQQKPHQFPDDPLYDVAGLRGGRRTRRQSFLIDGTTPGDEIREGNTNNDYPYLRPGGNEEEIVAYFQYQQHMIDQEQYLQEVLDCPADPVDEEMQNTPGTNADKDSTRVNTPAPSSKHTQAPQKKKKKSKSSKKSDKSEEVNKFVLQTSETGGTLLRIVRKDEKKPSSAPTATATGKKKEARPVVPKEEPPPPQPPVATNNFSLSSGTHPSLLLPKYEELIPDYIKNALPRDFLKDILQKQHELTEKLRKNPSEIFTTYTPPKEIAAILNSAKNAKGLPFLFGAQAASLVPKKIGTLTVEERKIKIEKYLIKRKQRSWNKKIAYDCRKRVADSRLRVKGRFVTKEQAMVILGISERELNAIDPVELRARLASKFGAGTGSSKKEGRKGGSSRRSHGRLKKKGKNVTEKKAA